MITFFSILGVLFFVILWYGVRIQIGPLTLWTGSLKKIVDGWRKPTLIPDYVDVWNNFWKDICEKNGELDLDAIQRELSDYHFLLDNVPKVYERITGGKLSKPNYYAGTVLAEYEDNLTRLIEEAIAEHEENKK